jgi:hypothetical protein
VIVSVVRARSDGELELSIVDLTGIKWHLDEGSQLVLELLHDEAQLPFPVVDRLDQHEMHGCSRALRSWPAQRHRTARAHP